MDRFCFACVMFVFVMLSCLLLVSLCSPAGKGFLCVVFSCILSLGQVWNLIVSIPDICLPLHIIRNNKTKCHRRCSLKAIHYNSICIMKDTLL